MSPARIRNAQCLLFELPNEILIKILSNLPTPSLLPLAVICIRIHDLIIRILHRRLLYAASLKHHKLILDCYHPASKFTEPYLLTEYIGTPGLSSTIEGEGLVYETGDHASRLGKLCGLYSKFKPMRRDDGKKITRQHPAGGSIPTWITPGQLPPEERDRIESQGDGTRKTYVAHRVSLDPEDSFSQLCVVTNLVKFGPRFGVFEDFENVSDGLVRIWRPWLKERASAWGAVLEREGEDGMIHGNEEQLEDPNKRTLWLDNKTDIGVTVRIKERRFRRPAPVVMHQYEEPAVSYSMEYEELLVRTTRLLLAVEKSLQREMEQDRGKAMVFGAFVNRT